MIKLFFVGIGGVFVGRANFIDKVTTQYVSVMSFNSIQIIVLSWLYYILGVALIFYEVKLQIDAYENKDEYFETKFKLILSVLMVGLIGLSFMDISLDYSRIVPGLSGLAQFRGGYDSTPSQKLADDMEYIETVSFKQDVKIALNTVGVVITGRGAY